MLTETDKLDAKTKTSQESKPGGYKTRNEEKQSKKGTHKPQRDKAVQKRKMNNPSRVFLRVVVRVLPSKFPQSSKHPVQNSTKRTIAMADSVLKQVCTE